MVENRTLVKVAAAFVALNLLYRLNLLFTLNSSYLTSKENLGGMMSGSGIGKMHYYMMHFTAVANTIALALLCYVSLN